MKRPRSPLAIVLLALVAEAPLHPYRMQQLIKHRGKDKIANVAQPNSVYQTIDSLQRAGLVQVRETARDERRPERTVYEITELGSRTLDDWLAALLSTPPRDFPDFPAALSLVARLDPPTVQRHLEQRATALEGELQHLEHDAQVPIPRLFLIEDEYQQAMVRAELAWVRATIADLQSGELSWSPAQLEAWSHLADEPTA